MQYGALPYRFTPHAALEILLVTTRQTRRWIIPKGWPIKGLRPAKSAAREAFEEAGVRGKISAKSLGLFTYEKSLDEAGVQATCEVRVFPLLVKGKARSGPSSSSGRSNGSSRARRLSLIREPDLKKLVATFVKRVAAAANKSIP